MLIPVGSNKFKIQLYEFFTRMLPQCDKHCMGSKQVRALDEGFSYTGDWFADMMLQLEHSHTELVDVHKKVWKDFDAELDFVDSVFAQMEEA